MVCLVNFKVYPEKILCSKSHDQETSLQTANATGNGNQGMTVTMPFF
jgi:hypothetical protein